MKSEDRQRLLMMAALMLLGLFAADRLVLGPLTRVWRARADRIAELGKKVADGALLLQRESSLRARWNQMRANSLPDNPSLAEQQVLKALDTWAQESGVSVTGMTPQWKRDADEYLTLDCRVEAAGDLGALSRFLYALEKSPMALKLESVELAAHDNGGQDLTMGVRLSGLVLTPGGHP